MKKHTKQKGHHEFSTRRHFVCILAGGLTFGLIAFIYAGVDSVLVGFFVGGLVGEFVGAVVG